MTLLKFSYDVTENVQTFLLLTLRKKYTHIFGIVGMMALELFAGSGFELNPVCATLRETAAAKD